MVDAVGSAVDDAAFVSGNVTCSYRDTRGSVSLIVDREFVNCDESLSC